MLGGTRINLLGASGSGASTTGRAVAAALELPYYDSDDYYHAASDPPFTAPRPAQERFDLMMADLAPPASWVLGGGVAGWEPHPPLELTLVVWLWLPVEARLARLRAREAARFRSRIAPGGDMHEGHLAFLDWAAAYDAGGVEGKTRERHEAYLDALTCPVLRVVGERPLEEIVAQVVAARSCG